MAYFLFILVNASLFVRPAEVIPSMQGWEIYFYVIVACLIAGASDILRTLTNQPLDQQPVTLCVFGILAAGILSPIFAGNPAEGWHAGNYFGRMVAYYLLLISVVTTPWRLRTLLLSILIFSGVVAALTVLRYHDVIELNTIKMLKDNGGTGLYGEDITINRLQGTGIFQDPNELCVMLAAMMPLGLYFLLADRSTAAKIVCAGLMLLFVYAIYLTRSRGGFIAFVGGLGVLCWQRYGWQKTAFLAVCGLPVLFLLFGGRQTEISATTGTASGRIELWRDWLVCFRDNPLTGNGMSIPKEADVGSLSAFLDMKQVAHNSYLQSFADLGFFGGCLFLGAFLVALWSIHRIGVLRSRLINPELRQWQPFLFGCVVAFCLGMGSLSISYIVPTLMMLGLAVVYVRLAERACIPPPPPVRFDVPLLGRFVVAGVCCLVSIYVFVRLFG